MKITSSCFAVIGFGYVPPWIVNAGFIVGNEKTLIVDTGPSYISAMTLHGYAQNVRPANQLIVLNTEKHLDHIAGNCFFREKHIDVYGNESFNRTKAELDDDINEWNNSILNAKRKSLHEEKIFFEKTEIANPNKILKDGDVFELGDVETKIISTPGHTKTNVSVLVEEEKVLYCGDCIVNKYLPNLEAGNVDDWKMWLTSLERVSNLDLDFVVPGHGNVIKGSEIQIEIERIALVLESAITSGKPPSA